MTGPRLNFRVDQDINRFVRGYAKAQHLTVSQAARELLRQMIGRAKPITRGWLEGFAAGHAEAQKAHQQALHGVPLPPDLSED